MRRLVAAVALGSLTLGAHADAIWGSWYAKGAAAGQAQGTVVFSFLPDGEYFLNDHGIHALDPTGQPGIERGTYTWDATTGAFTFHTILETDGQWGLSDGTHTSGSTTVQVTGNLLTGGSGADASTFQRVIDPSSAIVGGWYLRNVTNPGDLVVIDFLPDGTYLLGGDPPSTSFLEFGTYSWNPQTNAFQFHVIDTTDPNSGFNGSTVPTIAVNGDKITINSSDGIFVGTAVAAIPEMETWALMLAGIGVIGAVAPRRVKRLEVAD